MKKILCLLLLTGLLTINSSAFSLSSEGQYIPLDITYDQLMLNLENEFNMVEASSVSGNPRYMGATNSKSMSIEIIGDKKNICFVNLLISTEPHKQFLSDLLVSLVLIHNTNPNHWSGEENINQLVDAIGRAFQTENDQILIVEKIQITFSSFPALKLLLINIQHV